MLQTVEAEVDRNGNVRLLEPLHLAKPSRALVTLLDSTSAPPGRSGNAVELLNLLKSHRLPDEARPTIQEIDDQVSEARDSWV